MVSVRLSPVLDVTASDGRCTPSRPRSFACLRNSTKTSRRVTGDRTKSRGGKGEKEEERGRENRSANTKFRAARVVWEQFSHQIECAAFAMSSSPWSTQEGTSLKNVDGEIVIRLPTFFSFFSFPLPPWLLGSLLGILVAERMLFSRSPSNRYRRRSSPSLRQRRGRQGLSRNISHNY